MDIFPLKRIKLSNEYIMAYLFLVLVLYLAPSCMVSTSRMFIFATVLFYGLILDTILNNMRTNCLKCSVAASITIGILFLFYPNMSLLHGLVTGTIALVLGKHIYGGTGANVINPAMAGLLVLHILNPSHVVPIQTHPLIFLAMIMSLPLIYLRPFAAVGLIGGLVMGQVFISSFSLLQFILSGNWIWCSIVVTDPVTVSSKYIIALFAWLLGGLACVLVKLTILSPLLIFPLVVITLNIISLALEVKFPNKFKNRFIQSKIHSPYKKIVCPEIALKANLVQIVEVDSKQVLDKIKKNKVMGLGGAGFPTYDKLMSVIASTSENKTILVNAVECDPGLVHDKWVLRTFEAELLIALKLIQQCTNVTKVYIASKKQSPIPTTSNIKNIEVPDFYPVGCEKLLIQYALNLKLNQNDIPSEVGILVLNIQTLLSIYKAVILNEVVNSKYITVGDLHNKTAYIKNVQIGSLILNNIQELDHDHFFVGGGIMQSTLAHPDTCLHDSINFIGLGDFPRYKHSICYKCGECERRCPSQLKVWKIIDLYNAKRYNTLSKFTPEQCVSCGLCSYYCLAGINLSDSMKSIKTWTKVKPIQLHDNQNI